jgi:hypothetical protein
MTPKTARALDQLAHYMRTNQGIAWTLARVTEDLFDDSLLAGGDASRYEARGPRGRLHAQLSTAYLLAAGGGFGAPTVLPVEMLFDLDEGLVRMSWARPEGRERSARFAVTLDETAAPGARMTFHGVHASDGAGWVLRLMLL